MIGSIVTYCGNRGRVLSVGCHGGEFYLLVQREPYEHEGKTAMPQLESWTARQCEMASDSLTREAHINVQVHESEMRLAESLAPGDIDKHLDRAIERQREAARKRKETETIQMRAMEMPGVASQKLADHLDKRSFETMLAELEALTRLRREAEAVRDVLRGALTEALGRWCSYAQYDANPPVVDSGNYYLVESAKAQLARITELRKLVAG